MIGSSPIPVATPAQAPFPTIATRRPAFVRLGMMAGAVTGLLLLSALGAANAGANGSSYQRTLELQGIRFQVHTSGSGSQRQLTITTTGTRRAIPPIHQVINGSVVNAQVADLNSNSQPELYVFVQGAGSGSYGELVAYSVNNGRSLTPITLPELDTTLAQGYRGHDKFEIVEGCLVRRFPIYKPNDPNAHASGGERQICYKLKAGEAGWILQPSSVLKF